MAKNFYSQLCDIIPNQRYAADKALKHPWITRKKFDNIPVSYLEGWKHREDQRNMQKVIVYINNLDYWYINLIQNIFK